MKRRTRFLETLDRMMGQDRQGAIDDMLQVLREAGAITSITATDRLEAQFLQPLATPDQESACRAVATGRIVDRLSRFMAAQGVIRLKESAAASDAFTYGETEVRGTVEVVKVRDGR